MTTTFSDIGTKITLKSGEYVITDPCYVFPAEMWSDLCQKIFCNDKRENGSDSGVIEMDGHQIWWGSTTFGDGTYSVRVGGMAIGTFGVDAGLYAIFPSEFVAKYKPEMLKDRLAVVVYMAGDVNYENGDMDCEGVTVCTSGADRDEEEDEDEES